MLRRSTLIVVFLFAAVLAIALYLQRNPPSKTSDATPVSTPAPELLSLGSATIVKVKVENQEGKAVELVKTGADSWVVTSMGPAEGSDVNSTMFQLSGTKVLSKLNPAPSLSEMGLDAPANKITLSLDDGRVVVIDVGTETLTKSGYYVRVDGGEPVVASRYSIASILGYLENPPLPPTATLAETSLPASSVETPFPPESTDTSTKSP